MTMVVKRVPFFSHCRSIEVAMKEKREQIRKLEDEVKRDGEKTQGLGDKLKVSESESCRDTLPSLCEALYALSLVLCQDL